MSEELPNKLSTDIISSDAIDDATQGGSDDTPPGEPVVPEPILLSPQEVLERAKLEREKAWEETRQAMPLKVKVREVDFDHFKNRYSLEEGLEIIEVLRGHQHIVREIWEEGQLHPLSRWNKRMYGKPTKLTKLKEGEETWIQRVRIQSPQLLLLLSRLTGHRNTWAKAGPRVFYRPFVTFYYYLPQMKECLAILEENWAKVDEQGDMERATSDELKPKGENKLDESQEDVEADDDESFKPRSPADSVSGPIADSVIALRHVREYIEFVETKIIPQWKRAAGTTQRKVRFTDLWMSFQPGELVYVPPASETSAEQVWPAPANMSQGVWRLHTISRDEFPNHNLSDIPIDSGQELDLWCYFIDFNGVSYEPFAHRFSIKAFEDQRDITTLQVYPMRFLKDADKLLDAQRELGKWFQTALKEKYLYYDGWTLVQEPTDNTELEERGNPDHVDGQVIIDFVEAHKFDSELALKSDKTLTGWGESEWSAGEDPIVIRHWDCTDRSELLGEVTENVQRYEFFAGILSDRDFETNKFLRAFQAGNTTQIEPEDLVLLPRRVVAYTFRERKFVRLDIKWLKHIPTSEDVFKDLKIDEDHKHMVRALVKTHFQKQSIQKIQPSSSLNQDLIRGKGSGLVILLHGVPGVGKTATAEAVAQANKKPLFAITCGDLGFTPKEVETNLKDIFRLAHLWDCVLLLDEADIFLSRRDLYDLNRNALVSGTCYVPRLSDRIAHILS